MFSKEMTSILRKLPVFYENDLFSKEITRFSFKKNNFGMPGLFKKITTLRKEIINVLQILPVFYGNYHFLRKLLGYLRK